MALPELAAVLVAAGLALGSAEARTDGVFHYPDHSVSVSNGGDLELLLWVSEAALNASQPPEDLPAGWWTVAARHYAALRRGASRSSPETGGCLPLPSPEPTVLGLSEEESVPVTDYVSFAASSKLVVVAEILSVDPGALVLGEGGIGQRVRASVSEILRDDGGRLSPGVEVTFLLYGGWLALGQEVLCGTEEPERAVPEVGAAVVLTAGSPGGTPTFLNPSTVFPVHHGQVRVPPDGRFWYDEVSLERLRLSISLASEAGATRSIRWRCR